MKNSPINFPLVKLPCHIDQILFLIREELKSEKFFNTLYSIGIDDCAYQTRLGKLILINLDLYDGSDETFEFYQRLIETHTKQLTGDYDSLIEQTFKVYIALMKEKERRERLDT